MSKYSYMSSTANFGLLSSSGWGALGGAVLGGLSAGATPTNYDGTAGEWRNEVLKRAAIGASIGGVGGLGIGLLKNINKINTPFKSTTLNTPTTISNTKLSPVPTQEEILNKVSKENDFLNPDYEWVL